MTSKTSTKTKFLTPTEEISRIIEVDKGKIYLSLVYPDPQYANSLPNGLQWQAGHCRGLIEALDILKSTQTKSKS